MPLEIQQIGPESLVRYAAVPISFTVASQLRVTPLEAGLGGIILVEEPVQPPFVKDYDVDEPPVVWPEQFDVRNWAFFLAVAEDRRPVGGAAVAYNTGGIHMLEGRRDLTVLWDLRVHPEFRGKGVGARLFQAAEAWSRRQCCEGEPVRQMKIETQNINVNACRFYVRMGCTLGAIHRYAYYPRYPDETMLLWYKELV